MLKLTAILPLLAIPLSVAGIRPAQAATIQDCNSLNDPMRSWQIEGINTVNTSNDGNVTGIQDLQICVTEQIEGVTRRFLDTYEVNFTLSDFNTLFGDPSDPEFDTCEVGMIGNGLCFWGEGGGATSNTVIAIQAMNAAINNKLDPIPSDIEDEEFVPPIPIPLPNTRQFYLIPHAYDQGSNQLTSDQGRYDSSLQLPWTHDIGISNASTDARMYAQFQLTEREEVFEIPESSNLVGIIVAGVSILVFTQSNKF